MADNLQKRNADQKRSSPATSLSEENPSKSNAITIPSITLPKGGGALKGIDEKFQVNASNGTGSMSIPIPVSKSRNDFNPSLNLQYNSGSGNGPWGIGWEVSLPAIQLRTDKGLPRYRGEDVFMFSGAEDLVPFLQEGPGDWMPVQRQLGDFLVKRYRPRIEGGFAKIEQITHKAYGVYWKVTTRDNVTTFFGKSTKARIADPEDPAKIFKWLPEFSYDNKGNWISYEYKPDSNFKPADRDLWPSALHERNRKNGIALFANQYLKRISYGNRQAWYPDADQPFDWQSPGDQEHFFEVVLDYGDHDKDKPSVKEAPGKSWDFREDAFSNYRAGFEIRTARICCRVLLFHHFKDDANFGTNYLVRSLDLDYTASSINKSGATEVSYLSKITQNGYIRKPDGSYSKKSLPAIECFYQHLDWNQEIHAVSEENLFQTPVGLNANFEWTDFYGEGVSGIFTEQDEGWFYKENRGTDDNGVLELAPAKLIAPRPSFGGIGGALQWQDLASNGEKQLVVTQAGIKGYFQLSDDRNWEAFRTFLAGANINLGDPNIRAFDLTGDGMPDLVVTEDNAFVWYASFGKSGYAPAERSIQAIDEEKGPAVIFSEVQQTIFLADFTGDGLVDIVRIRNGEISYLPNKGFGKFGPKVTMSNAPVFDTPEQFNAKYIHLADISGTGASDILYTGQNKCVAYINAGGNSWSKGEVIATFPGFHAAARLSVIDLLSTGTSCLVWSSALPGDGGSAMRYIDLMSSKKPHIMNRHLNNMGAETSVEYKSSSWFYLQDKAAGKPWFTRLPFPVQVVHKTTVEEKVTRVKFSTQYSYHHGYYDHAEREFRGFGRVDQTDTEEYETWLENAAGTALDDSKPLFQTPILTKTWFHTGFYYNEKNILGRFESEYWYNEMTRAGFPVAAKETALPDTNVEVASTVLFGNVINTLSPDEWREVFRACKGMAIHQEVFGLDGVDPKLDLTPYSVATHNCAIRLLQPRSKNRYASFLVTESESIQYSYERNLADPRIAHTLNIAIDDLGNVTEKASVVYPRLIVDNGLPNATKLAQAAMLIIYTRSQLTNDCVDTDSAYHLRLPAETSSFELKFVPKAAALYQLADFTNILDDSRSDEAAYQGKTKPAVPGKAQRRLIEQVRTNYLKNDLSGPLALRKLEFLALPFENYQLAYTPALLTDIFAAKADDPTLAGLMIAGKFVHSLDETGSPDGNWWIPSGTAKFGSAAAFYQPVSFTDPYEVTTKLVYDGTYQFFIQQVIDAAGNTSSVDLFNLRTLTPRRMRDMNNNLSETITDELGLVKAYAVMGKGNEADNLNGLTEITDAGEAGSITQFFNTPDTATGIADSVTLKARADALLQNATTRFVYDFNAYAKLKPVGVATIQREKHFVDDNHSPIQLSFEYMDGLGHVAMAKKQVAPGFAKQVTVNNDKSFQVVPVDTSKENPAQLRWVGTGRTVLNNKGNPIKQYEPYFSVTPKFEDLPQLTEQGVTPILYYDGLSRLKKTVLPDGTINRSAFDSWKLTLCDANDCVLDTDCAWYTDRTGAVPNPKIVAAGKDPARETEAARKAAKHAGTPVVQHLDTLGRPVLSIEQNRDIFTGADEFYRTKLTIDIEGNTLDIRDPREIAENALLGNLVMEYKHDMLGHRVYHSSMDSGRRWLLYNVLGDPLRTWDERDQTFDYSYDNLHRPSMTQLTVGNNAPNIVERIFYGESLLTPGRANEAMLQADNQLGRPIRHYDTGGLVETLQYDFEGRPKSTTRKLYRDYKGLVNWIDANLGPDLEAAAFTVSSKTDALGRIIEQTTPDNAVVTPFYDETGLLDHESVIHPDAALSGLYIKGVEYNEKLQRSKIIYGNDVFTNFYYDTETLRLIRLETNRKDGRQLQDFRYTYDAVGNITSIEDKLTPDTFYRNQAVTSVMTYTYDALYRLKEATGRENRAALKFDKDNTDDKPFMQSIKPETAMDIWGYTQQYDYDEAGNITFVNHQSGNPWNRNYTVEKLTNRLVRTDIGQGVNHYVLPVSYHTQHGFITKMPHLDVLDWNFKEDLIRTVAQQVNPGNGTAETTYYQYDGQGQRLRKITENYARQDAQPTKKEERIYIGGYEQYNLYSGPYAGLQRITLSLMDDRHRFVMIETRNNVDDKSPATLVRYQLHNHVGSCSLELDNNAADPQVISYEEYHPFGTTAYQASNDAIKAAAKRYRFTGLERDEETGFGYHGARYYVMWLGRWASCDPKRIKDGLNKYQYCHDNPITEIDEKGTEASSILDYSITRTLKRDNTNWAFDTQVKGSVFGFEFEFNSHQEGKVGVSEGERGFTVLPSQTLPSKTNAKPKEEVRPVQIPEKKKDPVVKTLPNIDHSLHVDVDFTKSNADLADDEFARSEPGSLSSLGWALSAELNRFINNIVEQTANVLDYASVSAQYAARASLQENSFQMWDDIAASIEAGSNSLLGITTIAGIGGSIGSFAKGLSKNFASGANTVVYQLIDELGDAVYVGSSKNYNLPDTLARHVKNFKLNFKGLQIISEPVLEVEARQLETQLIKEIDPILNTLKSSITPPIEGLFVPKVIQPKLTLINPLILH